MCVDYVACDEDSLTLNEATNQCDPLAAQKKSKYGLIMLMLMIIAGGGLYVCLDDKHFCMQPSRTQLGP